MSADGRRPHLLAPDVILDVGASLKAIWKLRLRPTGTLVVRKEG
jgi:hypothetical protein